MVRGIPKIKFFIVLILAFVFVPAWGNASQTSSLEEWIEMGEEALFRGSIEETLEAHSIFLSAIEEYPDHPVINAYLAITRLLDLALREDQPGLKYLFEQYGLTMSGVSLNDIDYKLSGKGDGSPYLPVTAPRTEVIRRFMAGTLLEALEASIENLTKTAAVWTENDKHIIPRERLQADLDIELDLGDVVFARSVLEYFRFILLFVAAYDLNVDLREVFATANVDLFHPGQFLNRYPDLFKLLPAGTIPIEGKISLAKAREALYNAIVDYLAASHLIRNNPGGTEPGAEELIELDRCNLQREQWVSDNLSRLKQALEQGTGFEFILDEEIWDITDHDKGVGFTLELRENRSEGVFRDGCDSIGYSGDVKCLLVEGSQVSMRLLSPQSDVTLQGTLKNNETEMTGSYNGWVSGNPVSGTFTGILVETETKTMSFNPEPLFGDRGPYHFRDFLPELDCFGEPVRGTVGRGLPDGPDASLGGIMPDMTQEAWGFDYQPAGVIEIQDWQGQWAGIPPVFVDVIDDNDPDFPGSDIHELYLAKDDQNLYIRMTLADGPPNESIDPSMGSAMHYMVQFGHPNHHFGENPFLGAAYRGESGWEAFVFKLDEHGEFTKIHASGEVEILEDGLAWRVPLEQLGPLAGTLLTTWTHWAPSRFQPSDYNQTCLKIGPLTSLMVNIDAPEHDGNGLIYVGVFRCEGTGETAGDDLLYQGVIYPDEFSPGMTYIIEGLPPGEDVFVRLRWDHNYTGYVVPGDYAGKSGPVSLGETGETASTSVSLQTRYAEDEEGPPFFEWASVLQHNAPDGVYTAVSASLRDPLGSVPHTLESFIVTGPEDFAYTFSSSDYLSAHRSYYREIPGAAANGIYTFTAINRNGRKSTTCFYLDAGETIIPPPDAGTLQASGDPKAPTLSWGGPEYEGNLFYRARIYDADSGAIVWTSGVSPDTSVKVHQGALSPERNYTWRVEAFDDYTYIVSNQRAVTERIPLAINDSNPFFERVAVYSVPGGEDTWTAVNATVKHPDGSLPGSIDHLIVTGPDGVNAAILDHNDFLEPWQLFFMRLDGAPAPGVYKFEVTDTRGNSAVTYDYVDGSTAPVVDAGTLQASGGEGSPLVLSWAAPQDVSGPLYYRVIVSDGAGNWVSELYSMTETAVTVPGDAGLEQGGSYWWEVWARDSGRWSHHSSESRSASKQLARDNASPYFRWAAAYAQADTAGSFTAFDVSVYDPDGQVPANLERLEVEGPDGFSMDILNHPSTSYFTQLGEFWARGPAGVSPGVYTFTAEDQEGRIAITSAWLGEVPIPPEVDPATIQVTGNPMAPTVSWGAPPGYEARPYYRLRVYDNEGNSLYRSGREPQTFRALPNGIIQPGETYLLRVETQDHPDWVTYNARSNSVPVAWVAPEHPAMPLIRGRVTDSEGLPIRGILVQAYEQPCGDNLLGWAFTGNEGEFSMHAGAAEVFVKTNARFNRMPYQDKWFDWAGGTEDCSLAALLTLPGTRDLIGIDFSLERIEFDLKDVIQILRVVAGSQIDTAFPSADLDDDGRLGLPDAVTMLQEISGLR
ncbi:MAG TPA: hypothetical protein ENN79_07475 [Desulfobacteraceae bacterium]|nr:hypothetical protein [Desulfobacteraceae bacterium]